MKTTCAIILVTLSVGSTQAQETEIGKTIVENVTLERLNALRIESSILFRLENIREKKQLTYEIDTRDEALTKKNTSRSHAVAGNKLSVAATGTSINILFEFFNPLKYSYKIDNKEVVDPSTIAYESFYNNLIGIVKVVNDKANLNSMTNVEIPQTIEEVLSTQLSFQPGFIFDDTVKPRNQNGTQANNETDVPETRAQKKAKAEAQKTLQKDVERILESLQGIKSPELIDWALWFYSYSPPSDAWIPQQAKKQLDSLILKVVKIEKNIHQSIDQVYLIPEKEDLKKYYESYIALLFEDLRDAGSFSEFDAIIKQNKRAILKLETSNKDLEDDLISLKNAYFNLDSSPDIFTNYFMQYTINKLSAYFDKIKGLISDRKQLLDKFKDLMNEIDNKYISTKATEITTKPDVISVELGIHREVTITLTESNYSIENGVIKNLETTLYNFSVHVYTYNSMIAEFGLGTLLFPSVSTDTYVSSGDSIVSHTGTSNQFYSPAASLNLIPNIGKGQAFWLIQLAVGSSVDKPCVAIGTGVRIYSVRKSSFKNFSMVAGVVSCFVRKLDKLTEGSPANEAELTADLHYEPAFKPYIGLQINF